MAGKVTCIPATKNRFTALPVTSVSKRRVAAYARVSTDSDKQFTSYAAQIDYYTNYIQQHPEWEFVKVYTDEGISGLNTRRKDRPDRDQVRQPLRQKHRGQPDHHPQAQRAWRGMLL